MRKLLSSPIKMALSDAENALYQSALKFVSEISLNLMAVKVANRPDDFLGWSSELLKLCRHEINFDLLEPKQFQPLKKLEEILEVATSVSQLKMVRIASWPIFVDFIKQQSSIQALEERLILLDYIKVLSDKPLAQMGDNDLLAFTGKHTNNHHHNVYNFDVEWFASTKGAKTFHSLLRQQPEDFDHALSFIPLDGDVTPSQYQAFSSAFQAIFSSYIKEKPSGEKAPLAAATRLLAMRRPDQFVALTNAKIDVLCQGLSIAKFNNVDFDSYWQDMIGTIRTFAWWHQKQPNTDSSDLTSDVDSQFELKIWQARALFIDLFLYADDSLADQSNFIRMRDKVLNKNSTSIKGKKQRTKETAEMLVDRALSDEDLPEYILGKRESIVREVKNGKSVDHVIGLMRAIFG